jgi:two-component system capsular synthesis sensor histidine kinase RcsC
MKESNILAVDDNRGYLDMLREILESNGIRAICVEDGEEALVLLRERPFKAVITDLHMPSMDGLELAKRVREVSPDIPIIMLTADINPDIPSLARKAGVSKVLPKGSSGTEILAAIGEEKEKKEETPKESGEGDSNRWVCPRCGTRYWGWSAMKSCSKCGYEE